MYTYIYICIYIYKQKHLNIYLSLLLFDVPFPFICSYATRNQASAARPCPAGAASGYNLYK